MRMLTSLALTVALSTALALPSACGSPTHLREEVALGESFWLAHGDLAILNDGPTVLRFKRVVVDSRCPTDALIICVDAGNAELEFTIASEAGDETPFALNSMVSRGPAAQVVGGFRIELLEIAPPARLQPPLDTGEYRARLIVTLAPE
jgi:hypothetical protein